MLNGRGLFIWHDDRLYLGDWKDNMMHGEGTYRWGDGRWFLGEYKNDRKCGMGIYLWADGRAYHGQWENGKQHGIGFYMVPEQDQVDSPTKLQSLKIKKGSWLSGKRQEWIGEVVDEECDSQRLKYKDILQRKKTIDQDIGAIEDTMKAVVVQQLGDKHHLDVDLIALGNNPGEQNY